MQSTAIGARHRGLDGSSVFTRRRQKQSPKCTPLRRRHHRVGAGPVAKNQSNKPPRTDRAAHRSSNGAQCTCTHRAKNTTTTTERPVGERARAYDVRRNNKLVPTAKRTAQSSVYRARGKIYPSSRKRVAVPTKAAIGRSAQFLRAHSTTVAKATNAQAETNETQPEETSDGTSSFISSRHSVSRFCCRFRFSSAS